MALRAWLKYGCLISALIAGCNQATPPSATEARTVIRNAATGSALIKHIVIIVQENRSADNLFQFLPNANTQSFGLNTNNQQVPLTPVLLTDRYDLRHTHGINGGWLAEYNGGAMNGFNNVVVACGASCPPPATAAYGYVPQSEVQPYYTMAETYAFGDEMFQTNQGPSFPAHCYLLSGTCTISNGSAMIASENPETPSGAMTGGCDSPSGSTVRLINSQTGNVSSFAYPCFTRSSILDELDTAGASWHYYQAGPGPGLWNAPDALQDIWSNKTEFANVVYPPSQVLTDIANGNLADIAWVTPTAAESDHADSNNGTGPSWVASVVNAIGESQYWDTTAIVIVWDDWGGWYDHVKPQIFTKYELGFRVPIILVSPYAKTGYVSHVSLEFGSILKFIEETYSLPSLGTTDARANDLSDFFNFAQKPTPFMPIPALKNASYFSHQPRDTSPPDKD